MGLCQAMRNETFFGEGLQTKIDMFNTQRGLIKTPAVATEKFRTNFRLFKYFHFYFDTVSCGA